MTATFSTVTCPQCRKALESCPTNEHGFPMAGLAYDVGNIAKAEMGHQYYFTRGGRVALCSADRNSDRKAYDYATSNQGYVGTFAEWLDLPANDRAEYEQGAAGIPTA